MQPGGGGAGHERTRGANALRGVLLHVGLCAIWIASWGVSRIEEYAPHASLWFPPAGVAIAAFAVLGLRALPAIATGAFLVTLELGAVYRTAYPTRTLLVAGVLFAAAHTLAYGLGAVALRRSAGESVPRAVTAFLLVAPASAGLAALGGTLALSLAGLIAPGEGRAILLPWFIGDFVGVVALSPLLAALVEAAAEWAGAPTPGFLARVRRIAPARPGWGPLAARLSLCLLPLGISTILLVGLGRHELAASFLVFFAVVPLMWIVHTEGGLRTFGSVAFLSTAIAGAGALVPPGDDTTAYQFAMIVLAGSAYFGLAVPSLYLDNEQLRRLATTDGLTGAQTRAHFLDMARRESERSRRFGTPFSVVVLDIDRFKALNDTLGHAFGDAVLVEVVARLRRELRDGDVVGRIGGDELALLLPMTAGEAAAETAGRLAASLRERPIGLGKDEAPVTASFGVASGNADEGLDATLLRADRALYEAKRGGRDRVAVAPPAAAA